MLKLNRLKTFSAGGYIHVLWIGCVQAQPVDEEAFIRFYKNYQHLEESARIVQESHGGEAYLLTLFCGHHMEHIESLYKLYGAHPEVAQPNKNPSGEMDSNVVMLEAAREFVQRSYLDLWAAAYLVVEMTPIKKQGSRDEADPFSDFDSLGNGTESDPSGGRSVWPRDQLGFFYSEDLFLQKRVEELARLHGKDDSELVAGLTGRQIIAYMREHLPEPDPRVTRGGSILPQTRPIVDPDKRFLDGGGSAIIAGSSVDNKARRFLWPLLGLLLMTCAWGFIFVRKARQ